MSRCKMPPVPQICGYWFDHQGDDCSTCTSCWRCGWPRRVERCHIVPHARGGASTPGNLVLLCNDCHAMAPDVPDPAEMWDWLCAEAPDWIALTEVAAQLVPTDATEEECKALFAEIELLLRFAVGTNGGKFSQATRLWTLRKAVESVEWSSVKQ